MEQSFRAYIHPISVNSFYTGNRQFKSVKAKEWSIEVIHQLNQPIILAKLQKLREYFDPAKHTFEVHLKFAYPKDKLYTKKGDISSKTIDLSNSEKHLIDLLWLPKFFEELKNLNTDDRYVTKMISEKIESENGAFYTDITIIINNLN